MHRSFRQLAAVAGAIAGASIALAAPSAASAASSCATVTLSTASSANSCWRPFITSSPFNTPLGQDPRLAADDDAVRQHIGTYGWTFGTGGGFSIGAAGGSRPIFYASSSDPTMTIHCTDEEGPGTCAGSNGVDVNGAQINVPAGARPFANGDAHMTIIETSTGREYDLWNASVSGSTITAGTGAETDVDNGDGTGGGGDAAGFSLSAGLVRPAELASGHIDHALVVVVPCVDAHGADVGYTWPAEGGWGETCGDYWNEAASTAPELGQLMKLDMTPSQIASSGAPAWEQTVMTALADYGAYIEDTAGSWHSEGIGILTEAPASWTDLGERDPWSSVARSFGQSGDNLSSDVAIPADRLETVDTCVVRGTCPGTTSSDPIAVTSSLRSAGGRRLARARRSTHDRGARELSARAGRRRHHRVRRHRHHHRRGRHHARRRR